MSIPSELPKLSRFLIGPVTDLLTFYVDDSLAIRQPAIRKPGDHVFLKAGVASSWGSGQDCLDFDVTLLALNESTNIGTIKVSHLPPSNICITPPADWMKIQVTDTANNWFDTQISTDKYIALAGKETFDVEQQVDLSSGVILSATMDNPIVFQARECKDRHFLNCATPTSHKIVRSLKFTLDR